MAKKKRGIFLMKEKVKEIVRLHSLGYSKAEISRSVKAERKTVRSYIAKSDAAGVTYEHLKELTDEEYNRIFCPNSAGRRQKLEELDYKSISEELKKRGVTLQLLWEEYLEEHPEGYSYSQYCDKYRSWKKKQTISMHMEHKAGDKTFVDYSGMTVPIYDINDWSKVLFEAEVFVGVLGASNYTYFEGSESQALEYWIGSHERMFEYFGGVTSAVVPDNLKSGVTKADYYEPGINKTYQDFAEHYGVAVIPARVRKPKDKAKAEQGVQAIQRRALAVLRNQKFFSVAELNVALVELRERFNTREMKSYGASRKDLFLKLDKPALQALPVNKYEFARYKLAKVHYNYHVSVNGNFYSVPYEYRAEEVEVRIAEKSISIFRRSKRIAIHKRLKGKSQYSTVKEHMPEQHRYMDKWNPMRLIEWANRIGSQTQLQIEAILRSRQHPEQAYGSCLGILNLSKQHENFRLENACKVANELGSLSFKSIKNILENKVNTTDFTESRPVIHSNIRGSAQFH